MKIQPALFMLCIFRLASTSPLAAATIHVPADQPTIQAGIDAAVDGDTVLVADGTYAGEGNRDIDFLGKAITVRSENGAGTCIIDCQGAPGDHHRGFNFQSDETGNAVLRGFTIRGGLSDRGGAIRVSLASPTLSGLAITGNRATEYGGGLDLYYCFPAITNCTIAENVSEGLAGGIHCDQIGAPLLTDCLIEGNSAAGGGGGLSGVYASPELIRCVFRGNSSGSGGGAISLGQSAVEAVDTKFIGNAADSNGGAVSLGFCTQDNFRNCLFRGNSATNGGALYAYDSDFRVQNCTLAGNEADEEGGGVYCAYSGQEVTQTIFWGNTGREWPCYYLFEPVGDLVFDYTNFQQYDPLFAEGPLGVCYLSQQAAGQEQTSPCVDAGDPSATPPERTTRTDSVSDGGIIDLGYHYRLASPALVTGPGPAEKNPPLVRVFLPEPGAEFLYAFFAYGAPHYGVQISCGNVDGSGFDTILTGPGPGDIYGPHVRGFEKDGTPLPGLSFLAYGTNKYGVNVAAGDLDGDGSEEIITGAGPGAVFGPHVRAWNYQGASGVAPYPGVSYFAYGTPKWGVNVSAGDIDGDGYDEIVTGAGPGAVFGPHVRGWNYDGDVIIPLPNFSLFAWLTGSQRYGVDVFAGADVDGDGLDDVVTGRGPDPEADTRVKVFSYVDGEVVEWMAIDAFEGLTHGTSVAAGRF